MERSSWSPKWLVEHSKEWEWLLKTDIIYSKEQIANILDCHVFSWLDYSYRWFYSSEYCTFNHKNDMREIGTRLKDVSVELKEMGYKKDKDFIGKFDPESIRTYKEKIVPTKWFYY